MFRLLKTSFVWYLRQPEGYSGGPVSGHRCFGGVWCLQLHNSLGLHQGFWGNSQIRRTFALPTGGTNSRPLAQRSSCSIHSDNKHDVIIIPSSPFTPVACSVIIRTNRVILLSILRGLSLEELLVSSFVFMFVWNHIRHYLATFLWPKCTASYGQYFLIAFSLIGLKWHASYIKRKSSARSLH